MWQHRIAAGCGRRLRDRASISFLLYGVRPVPSGISTTLSPAQRVDRARRAALARTRPGHLIAALARVELDAEHVAQLRELLDHHRPKDHHR